ncbi:hypothetical protein JYT79_00005, partial [Cardiobacterium sp. AH-315-I02]|nr:hypothetical protein [Cardiobacterium sp. AH-315-I02]
MKISSKEFIEIVRENSINFDGSEIKLSDQLSDLGLDSLGFATTLYAIEERLGINVDEEYLENLTDMNTVADLVGAFK